MLEPAVCRGQLPSLACNMHPTACTTACPSVTCYPLRSRMLAGCRTLTLRGEACQQAIGGTRAAHAYACLPASTCLD